MRRAGALALAAVVLAGCGGSDGGRPAADALRWSEGPRILTPPTLRGDRVLRGQITNRSGDRITLEASALRLIDQRGRRVSAAATFIPGFARTIFNTRERSRFPGQRLPKRERRRIGLFVELDSGKSAPLTVSWHEPPGARTPVRIDYGSGSLEIPGRQKGL
jgi:hypothetical protein